MDGLTPGQEEYFRILESLHPSEDLQRSIEAAKEDLRYSNTNSKDKLNRGLSRVKGFTKD